MAKHYVEFLHPGPFFCSISEEEIAEREIEMVKLPDSCVGFRFFDKNKVGERMNVSGWYYQGDEMTIEQVKEHFDANSGQCIIMANMERKGYKVLVKTKFGLFIPMGESDTIILS